MASPALPRYRDTPYTPTEGIEWALAKGIGATLQPVEDELDVLYTSRDINEMIDRGWVKRSHRRLIDKAWYYTVIGGPA